MRDFGAYRAMLLDFGADPRAIDTMSLAEIVSMMKAMEKRRGKPDVPSDEERAAAMDRFAAFAAKDPALRLN